MHDIWSKKCTDYTGMEIYVKQHGLLVMRACELIVFTFAGVSCLVGLPVFDPKTLQQIAGTVLVVLIVFQLPVFDAQSPN